MTDENFEKTLQQKLEGLSRERFPNRDLWPGIEQALAHPQEKHSKRGMVAITACTVFILATFSAWQILRPQQQADLISQLNSSHQQQLRALYTNLEDQQALTENWQQQLHDLDSAAQDILKALESDPENMDLLKMLKQVYQQQLDLVEHVHQPKWQYIYDRNREVTL